MRLVPPARRGVVGGEEHVIRPVERPPLLDVRAVAREAARREEALRGAGHAVGRAEGAAARRKVGGERERREGPRARRVVVAHVLLARKLLRLILRLGLGAHLLLALLLLLVLVLMLVLLLLLLLEGVLLLRDDLRLGARRAGAARGGSGGGGGGGRRRLDADEHRLDALDGAHVLDVLQEAAVRARRLCDLLARVHLLGHGVAHVALDVLAEDVQALAHRQLQADPRVRRLGAVDGADAESGGGACGGGALGWVRKLRVAVRELRERALPPDVLRTLLAPERELQPLRADRVEEEPRRDVLDLGARAVRVRHRRELRRPRVALQAVADGRLAREEALDLRHDEEDDRLALADAAHAVRALRVVAERQVLAERHHRARARRLGDVHARRVHLVVKREAALLGHVAPLEVHHHAHRGRGARRRGARAAARPPRAPPPPPPPPRGPAAARPPGRGGGVSSCGLAPRGRRRLRRA